jgi:hypothetical protein
VSQLVIVANPRAEHQSRTARALVSGLARHGIGATIVPTIYHAQRKPLVCCWGWRAGKELRKRGSDVLVMERGYLGDRFQFTSLGWNGLNGYADFGSVQVDAKERFERYFPHLLMPWNSSGEYVVIAGQVPGDQSLRGMDLRPWYEKKAREAFHSFGIPVFFRPHPEAVRKGHHKPLSFPDIDGSLEQVISGARLVVTFNSNTSVDSILAGKPCLVGDQGSMAWDMAIKQFDSSLEEPEGRLDWARELSCTQWLTEEISSGEALFGFIERFHEF